MHHTLNLYIYIYICVCAAKWILLLLHGSILITLIFQFARGLDTLQLIFCTASQRHVLCEQWLGPRSFLLRTGEVNMAAGGSTSAGSSKE